MHRPRHGGGRHRELNREGGGSGMENLARHFADPPPSRFRPMGSYYHRGEADEAAEAMGRQMPWTRWESCLVGAKFAIRRVA